VNIELQCQVDITEYGENINEIKDRIKLIMGEDVKVEFEFVDVIEPSSSGKYLYTVSKAG
jgi:phenylacetate-CoA ligase